MIDKCDKNSVCIHVRRGDYVNSIFEICNAQYYNNSIEYIKKKIKTPKFYVFSDDIDYCKKYIKFAEEDKVIYMNNNDAVCDLLLMSNCNNFIMSNSTFSYWGQFLNKNGNKIVIAPEKWNKNNLTQDIYEDSWIKMSI